MIPNYDESALLFNRYGLDLTHAQYEKLDIYARFLVEYNKKVNLTTIVDGYEILKKHFLDSVLVTKYAEIPENSRVIDVGTGAGFPSVPVKIFRSDIKITLLDSLNKRITFLRYLCEKLGVEAEFIHGRAEDFGKMPRYREKFDVSCARAVANLGVLTELCMPFVRVGGVFIAMKGPGEDAESGGNPTILLGAGNTQTVDYDIEGDFRRLILMKKISQTSSKYPRNSSQIKKKPL